MIVVSWSYDPELLHDSPKDQVRFLVGDIKLSEPLVEDEEILFALSQNSNVYFAAAIICDSIAGMFSRKVDRQTGDVRNAYSQRAKAYAERAKQLRAQGGSKSLSLAKPLAGGITVSDKTRARLDPNRVRPSFARGQFGGRSL